MSIRTIRNYFPAILIALTLVSCKGNEPSLEDHQNDISKKLQASVWKTESVKMEGDNITPQYADFTLTIGANTYSTTHGDLAWPASGTWLFAEKSTTQVIRDGTIPVDFVLSKNAKKLTLTFHIPESTYQQGRSKSLEGDYEFNLTQ